MDLFLSKLEDLINKQQLSESSCMLSCPGSCKPPTWHPVHVPHDILDNVMWSAQLSYMTTPTQNILGSLWALFGMIFLAYQDPFLFLKPCRLIFMNLYFISWVFSHVASSTRSLFHLTKYSSIILDPFLT
jgi:hypothetical protein